MSDSQPKCPVCGAAVEPYWTEGVEEGKLTGPLCQRCAHGHSSKQEARNAEIHYWWEGGFPGAFAADISQDRVASRLYTAFRKVLLAMPDEDFRRFFELQPTIVCQPRVDATAYSYHIPVWPVDAKKVVLRVLYFRPDLRRSEEHLIRLVAHEVAHLILGHVDAGHPPVAGDIHAEQAADRKSESWGFKGR